MIMFLFILMVMFTTKATAAVQPNHLINYCENSRGNYTTNSTYQSNLNHLLSNILLSNTSQNVQNYGFYNSSYGDNSDDKAYAIGVCRGDLNLEDCRSCLSLSISSIKGRCPNQKEVTEWYDACMLRYSNRSMFGIMETIPMYPFMNTQRIDTNVVDDFNQAVTTLLGNLRKEAAGRNSLRKYAVGNTTATLKLPTIYGLAQCTPDLSHTDCNDCLGDAFGALSVCCMGRLGARSFSPSCTIHYEIRQIVANDDVPSASPPSTTSNTTRKGKKSNISSTVISVVVPTVVSVVMIISICAYSRVRKAKKKVVKSIEAVDDIQNEESLQYDFGTIRVATDNFSDANKLGQGGFGAVYRGKLYNGQEIAVKRLSMNSGQGNLEFKNEVILVAKLQHRNLVRLLGFCLEGNERLIVYEFVPNASLDHFIFDHGKRANLDWDMRFKIITGVARGLLYLHEDSRLRIIHRDLKASNILLDSEMNAKISDFGMAKMFVVDQTQGNTNRIVGTYGYMAPEYALHGHFSVKSDVFSFGVLLLEIISGQKNSCFCLGQEVQDLLTYTWTNWRGGRASNIVDGLMRARSTSEIMRCIHIALLCVQENVTDRPTMNKVVIMLSSNSLTLPVPSRPAFFMHSSTESNMSGASDHNSRVADQPNDLSKPKNTFDQNSANGASITDLYPR